MKFIFGVNYWGADWGTEMWRHYDGKKIREEMKQLSEYGIQCLRVFPNWRDFQPIERANTCYNRVCQYVNANTGEVVEGDGVDMDRIEEFRDFCRAAEEYGITLVVSIVTGWMSGKQYFPPALTNKNLINDPECQTWMRRFIHRFVRELKNEKSIIMWDLGNESNDMGKLTINYPYTESYEAYVWTSLVRDSIVSEDNTRPVSSGMHGLVDNGWKIEHQAEICDMLTTHPYPSPSVGGDLEPYNRLRTTLIPTVQSLYYSGVGKKPVYIQEAGTLSNTRGNRDMSAQFMRINILSALANGLCGYQWWCAWDQEHLNFPPYTWSAIEQQLGIFDKDRKPKPVANMMKKMSAVVDSVPNPFPKRKSDGVCILAKNCDKQKEAIATLILGKQAGLDLDVSYCETANIPESDLYIMPVVMWSLVYKPTWDAIMDRVKNGATFCMTFSDGDVFDFENTVGAKSNGFYAGRRHTAKLGDIEFKYSGKEVLLDPTTAEVVCRNEEGNPAIIRNKIGKGYVYFINFAPENLAYDQTDGFNDNPYYKIYREIAKDIIAKKPVYTDNPDLGITVNPENEKTMLATVLNYSDKDIVPEVEIRHGYKIKEVLYGSLDNIPACDGVILRLEK